jgi:REP element-mobilizing transposase RayT
MANTYSQIFIQVVFAVEGRQNLIDPIHNDDLQKYITGIVTAQRQKLIAINNMPDHAHILIGKDQIVRFQIWLATSKPDQRTS